jgi:hypothetical protein
MADFRLIVRGPNPGTVFVYQRSHDAQETSQRHPAGDAEISPARS